MAGTNDSTQLLLPAIQKPPERLSTLELFLADPGVLNRFRAVGGGKPPTEPHKRGLVLSAD